MQKSERARFAKCVTARDLLKETPSSLNLATDHPIAEVIEKLSESYNRNNGILGEVASEEITKGVSLAFQEMLSDNPLKTFHDKISSQGY